MGPGNGPRTKIEKTKGIGTRRSTLCVLLNKIACLNAQSNTFKIEKTGQIGSIRFHINKTHPWKRNVFSVSELDC